MASYSRPFVATTSNPNNIRSSLTSSPSAFVRSNSSSNVTTTTKTARGRAVRMATQILESPIWRATMVIAAVLLLFGAQIHFLFLPRSMDMTADVIFFLTMVCCFVDIVCRWMTEDYYAPGICCLCRKADDTTTSRRNDLDETEGEAVVLPPQSSTTTSQTQQLPSQSQQQQQHHQQQQEKQKQVRLRNPNHRNNSRGCCGSGGSCCSQSGSFLFWCDLASALTLLWDISWFNVDHFSERHIVITLGSFGIPERGLETVNQARPFELNVALLVTICQSARLARFIRSSRAVKISAKINWYLLLNLLSPMWWWQQCRRCWCRSQDASSNPTDSPPPTLDESGAHKVTTVPTPTKSKSNPISSYARVWQWLGRSPLESPEYCRHLAATKIQRAWRAILRERQHMEESYGFFSSEFNLQPGTSTHNLAMPLDGARLQHQQLRTQQQLEGRMASNVRDSMNPPTIPDDGTNNSSSKRRNESQVGTAMRELTEQRVAVGIIIALLLTVIFTYTEENATRPTAMIVLHNQTAKDAFADKSLTAARSSAIPDLFRYQLANGQVREFNVVEDGTSPNELRPRERLRISIKDADWNRTTEGVFSIRDERREQALVALLSTIFILLVWFFGVAAFAGPVMVLVVIPIERMVRLLAMLMVDPLGYQSTPRYKRFVDEENEITKNTRWTKEILKGMETSFLMSTILRIGSLMKVGFGSAGVEIIRNNLEKGQNKNMLVLSSQGSTVSCIFLFCDIRNFTDATECLQEEVFVFTNRIAAVVHSNCHSLGGSANKNVGDAFLLSWQLDELSGSSDTDDGLTSKKGSEGFTAKNNQADKALLSVVRICMALHYDDYYIGTMTETARQALVNKLKHRKGPIVQMGFGLHAGRAVQGAIGSQRKIDATYVSEAVERAEFLESSTKQYGLKMLMSDSFHRLLHPSNRRRCRKIDQILIREDDDDDDAGQLNGEIMDLFTFDLDINALWADNKKKPESLRETDSASEGGGSKRAIMGKVPRNRRMSVRLGLPMSQDDTNADEYSQSGFLGPNNTIQQDVGVETEEGRPPNLVLPTGPALYNANVWTSEDMRTMRQLYSDGLFFQKYMSGLQSFYSKDWDHASQCFSAIIQRFEDGPSRYFMNQIEKHNGKPPRDFLGYGTA